MKGRQMPVKKCWVCKSGEVKIISIEAEQRGRWAAFVCYNCDESWPENIANDIINSTDPEFDAIWLGQQIFQTAYFCLHIAGYYRKEEDRMVYVDVTEEDYLKKLDELKDLLYRTEYNWGTRKMDEVIIQCNGKLAWGLEELFTLSKKVKRPLVKKKAEDIIAYLSYFTDKITMHPVDEQF